MARQNTPVELENWGNSMMGFLSDSPKGSQAPVIFRTREVKGVGDGENGLVVLALQYDYYYCVGYCEFV